MSVIKNLYAIAIVAFLMLFGTLAHAQDTKLTLVAVDGRNGKPLPSQRLLVFIGESQEGVRLHKQSLDVTTDRNGLAVLPITQTKMHWIQVFVDYRTLCQTEPNRLSFNVAEIVSSGLVTPNSCGSLRRVATTGQLVVFARPATLREKMNW
jgi:hypothetical protein